MIRHEAHALANLLLGRNDLPRVVETRRLWEEKVEPTVDVDAEESPLLPDEPGPPPSADPAEEGPPC